MNSVGCCLSESGRQLPHLITTCPKGGMANDEVVVFVQAMEKKSVSGEEEGEKSRKPGAC